MKLSNKRSDSFSEFLKQNRPEAPECSYDEARQIWDTIQKESWQERYRRYWMALSLVAAVFLLTLIFLKGFVPDSNSHLSETELALINDSMDLDFMETEDENEVVEFVSVVQ